jgi:hypothetical protein
LREARTVNKGWVAVGLILLVSSLAGFQVINSSAYAQLLENDTADSSSVADLPSDLLQNQFLRNQDSLIATPGPSSDDLNPNTEQESETIGNSIVQDGVPENRQEGVVENPSQPMTDDIDGQDNIANSDDQDQQDNKQDRESKDSGNDDDDEGEKNDQDDTRANDRTSEIPSSLRIHEDICCDPPFP